MILGSNVHAASRSTVRPRTLDCSLCVGRPSKRPRLRHGHERATLVGEATGGGAHPVDGVRVDEHIVAIVPVGRAINPITKSNWEGKGVEPHVPVPASEALDEAKALLAAKK